MENFQTFVLLMFFSALLIGLAQRIQIPYPIALVIGGTFIGFLPYQQEFVFNPNLVLLIVLPPLLYYGAFGISSLEFSRNLREIIWLALGLVALTTFVIGILFKWLFPQFSWSLAFAFGAIVSPPDAIAATSILRRFSISPKLVAILEGESLINDASALVLYRLAVVALLSGTFSMYEGSIEFLKTVSGGVVIGIILGYTLQNFSRYFLQPVVGVVFSFTIPYLTFIVADFLTVSGVLAVVTNGLIGSQILIRHHSPLRRILGYATWDIFVILLNCFVFILIGLQLRTLINVMNSEEILLYTGYALLITFTMIALRMAWVYTKSVGALFKAKVHAKSEIRHEATLIGWCGMRGIVSLVAALGLPTTLMNGTPLEGRNELILITFEVILFTLLIPGLSLPWFIRWLKIQYNPEQNELPIIRQQLQKVAEDTIHELHMTKKISDEDRTFLMSYILFQTKIEGESGEGKTQLSNVRKQIFLQKRKKLFELWKKREINDRLLSQLEQELDLEETHFARSDLK